MSGKSSPTFDLNVVDIGKSPAEIISAIPLEPAAWIGIKYPTLLLPNAKWLAALYPKIVQLFIWYLADFGNLKPQERELVSAVIEVATCLTSALVGPNSAI